MGFAILVIGRTGSGKSSFIKKKISIVPKKNLLIYDVNNEYQDFYPYPLLGFEEFTSICSKAKNAVMVLEEATIFLSNKGNSRDLREILVRKRWTDNTIFLVFHSLRAVPKYIFDLCNYVALFKTNDSEDVLNEFKHPGLNDAFYRVKNSGEKWPFWIVDIYGS